MPACQGPFARRGIWDDLDGASYPRLPTYSNPRPAQTPRAAFSARVPCRTVKSTNRSSRCSAGAIVGLVATQRVLKQRPLRPDSQSTRVAAGHREVPSSPGHPCSLVWPWVDAEPLAWRDRATAGLPLSSPSNPSQAAPALSIVGGRGLHDLFGQYFRLVPVLPQSLEGFAPTPTAIPPRFLRCSRLSIGGVRSK